ncbi:LacI family DNA-binding transcriptional regulator [Aminobacter sp. MSH1]|uniref:LacI family DNA-binding transcriptional regulator n=1 Tax=Aminobacter sp. MSH1 TaxID=374606 RepID=UPI00131ED357|nr:LacI family DNA-binding transcriptional regulator [Aminobacter sp. MSH1]
MQKKNEDNQSRRRASLLDVAELAGVARATVDRVLNERGNVSQKTLRKVVDAANQLRLRRTLPIPYQGRLRFDTILGRRDAPFSVRLNNSFMQCAAALENEILVHRNYTDESSPELIAEQIRTTPSNGFVVLSQQDPRILDAIAEVASKGIPVVTIGSDLPQSARYAYVGIDNYRAGRSAFALIANSLRGQSANAVVFTQSLTFDAHTLRLKGFLDAKAEYEGDIEVARVFYGTTGRALIEAFVDWTRTSKTEVQAIYNTTTWDNHVARAIRNYKAPRETVVIGHELTQNTVPLLTDGFITYIIDQRPEMQARNALSLLLGYHRREASNLGVRLHFSLHTAENVSVDTTGLG